MLRKPLVAAAGVAIAFCALAASTPRRGAADSGCTATTGVTVIVDFTHFGGAIERGCEPGSPANALDAVHDAGFATAGTTQYGDAFVCRIDGLPSPKSEACAQTPPAKSSWSFYYARPTDRVWTYSSVGVLTYQPGPGTLLAFAFGNFAKPGVLPSGAVAPTTTTTTVPRHTPRTLPRSSPPTRAPGTALHDPGTTAPGAPLTSRSGASVPPGRPAPSSTGPTPTTRVRKTARRTPTAAATSTTSGPRIIDKTAAGPVSHDSPGSPLAVVLTVGLVAVLGTGALTAVMTRRRRSA